MKYIFIFILLLSFFVVNSYGQSKILNFVIQGKVKGFPDNTKLYLSDLTDGTYNLIDSALILNGKFTFSRYLKSNFLKVGISTTDYKNRFNFWVERGNFTVEMENGNFKDAKFLGSKLQVIQEKLYKVFDTAKSIKNITYKFISQNTNSVISATLLYDNRLIWGRDTISKLYKILTKEIKYSYYGKNIFDFILLNRNIKIGDNFVDFTQKDTLGNTIKLSDFKGKVILLEFWGSWCEGCRENNANFLKIYEEFKLKGFEIFGVAAETKRESWVKAINMDKLPWINVTDFKGDKNKGAVIYGVNGYPTNFLINRNGKIVAVELYGEDLRNELLKIL